MAYPASGTVRAAKKTPASSTARDVDYLLDADYLFGQNMTEHNPAPSPSGHPLLSSETARQEPRQHNPATRQPGSTRQPGNPAAPGSTRQHPKVDTRPHSLAAPGSTRQHPGSTPAPGSTRQPGTGPATPRQPGNPTRQHPATRQPGLKGQSPRNGRAAAIAVLKRVRHVRDLRGLNAQIFPLREPRGALRAARYAGRATRADVLRTARYRYRSSDPTYETAAPPISKKQLVLHPSRLLGRGAVCRVGLERTLPPCTCMCVDPPCVNAEQHHRGCVVRVCLRLCRGVSVWPCLTLAAEWRSMAHVDG
eukprot:scaffold6317_cov98-Phaeocystis_antarctica.AAC.9